MPLAMLDSACSDRQASGPLFDTVNRLTPARENMRFVSTSPPDRVNFDHFG